MRRASWAASECGRNREENMAVPSRMSGGKLSGARTEAIEPVMARQCGAPISVQLLLPRRNEKCALVPFQLVRANFLENALSMFASDPWTVIWPKKLERH